MVGSIRCVLGELRELSVELQRLGLLLLKQGAGQLGPVKRANGLYSARPHDGSKSLKAVDGRHAAEPKTRELSNGSLVTRRHPNVCPRSPLHTRGGHPGM